MVTALRHFSEQGLVTGKVDMAQLVDHSFVDAAVKALGPNKK